MSTEDFDTFVQIFANAYPGIKITSAEEKKHLKERMLELHEKEPTAHLYGLFRAEKLLGGMCIYDFTMNLLGHRISVGGVGQVAVDLPHKKEHVAKEMMAYFMRRCRERSAPLALLYPFRPDFYKEMGFGYGTKMNQYRLKPAALPQGVSKSHVRYLGKSDRQALLDCYTRYASNTHGMIDKSETELTRLLERPQHRIVGYEKDGRILGYLVFTFEHGESFIVNDIHVREFIYEDREALLELLTFLHTQADQIRHIIINTQDEFFHHLLLDPRNGSNELIPDVYHESNLQGVGLMYRVVDVPAILRLLEKRNFGGQTCKLKLTVEDSFLPENGGSTLLHFQNGRLSMMNDADHEVEVRMKVAEFSSLLMGTVNLTSLYKYGLAEISDPRHVGTVENIFAVKYKPVCTTPF